MLHIADEAISTRWIRLETIHWRHIEQRKFFALPKGKNTHRRCHGLCVARHTPCQEHVYCAPIRPLGGGCSAQVFAPRQFEQTLNATQFLQILHDLSTIARETSIRAGGASRSTRLRTDDGHNELEHSENVHAGLYAHLASSPSMAETRRGSSAVTSGANRATTSPLRLSRNFSKFHSTSAEFSEFTP
jgi:hypothetical protein